MSYKYVLYEEYLKKAEEKIKNGEPVQMEIRDETLKTWLNVKVLIGKTSGSGEPAAVLAPFGDVYGQGEWYVKILEEIEDD